MCCAWVLASGLGAPGDWPEPRQNGALTGAQPMAGAMVAAPKLIASADLGRTASAVRQVVLADESVVGLALHGGALHAFAPPGEALWSSHPEGLNFTAIAAVDDFDGDGTKEVLLQAGRAAEPFGAAVLVSLQDGAVLWRYDVEPMSYAWYLYADDYTEAPGKEIVVLMHGYPPDPKNGYIALFGFDGPGAAPVQRWRYDFDAYTCFPSLLRSDIDGDGAKEIVVQTHSRMWCLDAASGEVKHFAGWDVAPANVRSYGLVEFRDLDGDGDEDFLCIANFAQHHEVLLNNGGVFEKAWGYGWPESVTTGKVATVYPTPAVGDVDGDGRLDVVLSMFNSEDEEAWLLRVYDAVTGELRFRRPGVVATHLSDLDGDGVHEIVVNQTTVAAQSQRDGAALLSLEKGTWSELWSDENATALPVAHARIETAAGRFDLTKEVDGKVTAVPFENKAKEQASYFSGVPAMAGPALGELIAADVDSDGRNELCLFRDGLLDVYELVGDELVSMRSYASTCLPVVADMNGDGLTDIVTVSASADHPPIVEVRTPSYGDRVLWRSALAPPDRSGLPHARPAYLRAGRFTGKETPDLYLWAGTPLGRSIVIDGLSGEVVWEKGEIEPAIERYWGPTINLASVHDYDGDGAEDLIFTNPDYYCVASGRTAALFVGPAFPPTIFNQPSQGLYTLPALLPKADGAPSVALVAGHYFQGVMSLSAEGRWHALPAPGEARSGIEGFIETAPGEWLMGFGRQNGRFACVNVTDGSVRWEIPLDGAAHDTISCDIDGDGKQEFLFATSHGTLYAAGDDDGAPRTVWQANVGAGSGTPIAADLDGDGKSEIALQTNTGALLVLGASE